MSKYYITGNAGSGKSTTILTLKERGFKAYDIDELPDIRGYLDRQNNTVIDELPKIDLYGKTGFTRYSSFIKESGLKKLLATNETIFVGGSAYMQEQYYPLFDKIFGLVVPKPVLEERLANRTNNPTGNNDQDRAWLLSINDRVESRLQEIGAIIIDSNQAIDNVVAQILDHANIN